MASVTSVPPLVLRDANQNPEHYEFLAGRWVKKESVGRREHSAMGRVIFNLFRPYARSLGCGLEQEWSIIQGEKRVIPDVTLCSPAYQVEAGYLVAPALLAVESRSAGQRLQALVSKCIQDHHPMGTRYCWIIDIEAAVVYECHAGDSDARRVHTLTAEAISVSADELLTAFQAELE